MRPIALLMTGLSLLTAVGCPTTRTSCAVPYYFDADGDGWGDPGVDPILACAPSCMYTAQNALDCDDQREDVTALVGDICPVDAFGEAPSFAGFQTPAREYVAYFGNSPQVSVEAAEEACGDWGGGLATFKDTNDLEGFIERIAVLNNYAGYVALAPSETGGWAWEGESNILMEGLWCGGAAPTPTGDDERLALVKVGASWCFGRAEDAPRPMGAAPAEPGAAHAICGRARPFPETYAP